MRANRLLFIEWIKQFEMKSFPNTKKNKFFFFTDNSTEMIFIRQTMCVRTPLHMSTSCYLRICLVVDVRNAFREGIKRLEIKDVYESRKNRLLLLLKIVQKQHP